MGWGGGGGVGGACARELICGSLLPDVCSYCVSRNESVSVAGRGPRPTHHLLFFKLLGLSETEDVLQKRASVARNSVKLRLYLYIDKKWSRGIICVIQTNLTRLSPMDSSILII